MKGGYFEESKIWNVFISLTLFLLTRSFHMSTLIVLMSLVRLYNLNSHANERKPNKWEDASKLLTGCVNMHFVIEGYFSRSSSSSLSLSLFLHAPDSPLVPTAGNAVHNLKLLYWWSIFNRLLDLLHKSFLSQTLRLTSHHNFKSLCKNLCIQKQLHHGNKITWLAKGFYFQQGRREGDEQTENTRRKAFKGFVLLDKNAKKGSGVK